MKTNSDAATETYTEGFNCAQAVLSAFCEKYGMEKDLAFKVSGGFGGGLRSGEVCGAVSGAVMVIGLKYGQFKSDDAASKKECYQKTEEFVDKFREVNGNIACNKLLGYDIRTDRENIQKHNLFRTKCVDFIASASALLEELGY